MFSCKQGTFLLRLWYDAVFDLGLNPGPPALDASTISQGYRDCTYEIMTLWNILTTELDS